MSVKLTTCSFVALFSVAGLASASTTTTTFDLTVPWGSSGYGNQGNSFTLAQGDLSATFAGNSFSSIGVNDATNQITSATIQSGNIYRWGSGAGVVNSSSDNSHTVDGSGWKDYIEISFSQIVTMHEVKFSYFDAYDVEYSCRWTWHGKVCSSSIVDDDDFRWMYDSSEDGAIGVGDYISANQDANPFQDFGGVSSSVFGFGAFEGNDDWKLKKITIKYDDLPPGGGGTPVVPLPAGGLLLLGGLAAFAGMRRRDKR